MSLRLGLICIICLSLLTVVSAVSPDDLVVVEKPLLVEPAKPLTVTIYNGGDAVWTDLEIIVEGAQHPVYYREFLEPLSFGQVEVPVPLRPLLDAKELSVSLVFNGQIIDSRTLPVELLLPFQGVMVDPFAAGPQMYLFYSNPTSTPLEGLMVELTVLDGKKVVYADLYGPFVITDSFVWSTLLPKSYLYDGEFDVQARFSQGVKPLVRTASTFTYEGEQKRWGVSPLAVAFLVIAFLLLFYVIIEVSYKRKKH